MTHYGQTLKQFAGVAYKGKYMNKGEMKKNKINMEHIALLMEDGLVKFTKAGTHKSATQIWYLTEKGQMIAGL